MNALEWGIATGMALWLVCNIRYDWRAQQRIHNAKSGAMGPADQEPR